MVGDPFGLGVLERSPLVPDVPRRSFQILAGIGDCRRAGKLIIGIELSLCRFGIFAGSLGRIGFRWSDRARIVFRLGLGRRLRGRFLLAGVVVGFFRLVGVLFVVDFSDGRTAAARFPRPYFRELAVIRPRVLRFIPVERLLPLGRPQKIGPRRVVVP